MVTWLCHQVLDVIVEKNCNIISALDKREYLMVFEGQFYFSFKPYVVTPHLNRLVKTVQMRVTTCFYAE